MARPAYSTVVAKFGPYDDFPSVIAPKLEHLRLRALFLPFYAPSLRILHLDFGTRQIYTHPRELSSLSTVLDILQKCLLLEDVSLHMTLNGRDELICAA
jgi:hypothetical protein